MSNINGTGTCDNGERAWTQVTVAGPVVRFITGILKSRIKGCVHDTKGAFKKSLDTSSRALFLTLKVRIKKLKIKKLYKIKETKNPRREVFILAFFTCWDKKPVLKQPIPAAPSQSAHRATVQKKMGTDSSRPHDNKIIH